MSKNEDGKGALYFVKPQHKLDEIDPDMQIDAEYSRFYMGMTIFFGIVVCAPVIGLLLAGLIKWWIK